MVIASLVVCEEEMRERSALLFWLVSGRSLGRALSMARPSVDKGDVCCQTLVGVSLEASYWSYCRRYRLFCMAAVAVVLGIRSDSNSARGNCMHTHVPRLSYTTAPVHVHMHPVYHKYSSTRSQAKDAWILFAAAAFFGLGIRLIDLNTDLLYR